MINEFSIDADTGGCDAVASVSIESDDCSCDVICRQFSKHFNPIVLGITRQKNTQVADNKAILWKREKLIRNTHLWFVESKSNRNE